MKSREYKEKMRKRERFTKIARELLYIQKSAPYAGDNFEKNLYADWWAV